MKKGNKGIRKAKVIKRSLRRSLARAMSRSLLWGFFAVVMVICVAYVILRSINLDSYKPQIERAFQANTGLVLQIQGHIRWANPFRLRLDVEDAVIFNSHALSQNAPLAEVPKISFIFGYKALFTRNFFPREIQIENANLVLKRHQSFATATSSFEPTKASPSLHRISPFGLTIKNSTVIFTAHAKKILKIKDAVLTLDNAKKQMIFTMSADFQKQWFDLTANVGYHDQLLHPPYDVSLNLTTQANQLHFKGIMDPQNKKMKGVAEASGKDLSNILRVVGINILQTGSYSIKANVLVKNKNVLINILHSHMLNGHIFGTVNIHWSPSGTALYTVDVRGLGLNAGDAFRAVKLTDKFTNGDLFVHYQMTTKGHTGHDLLANQSGILSLGIKDTQFTSLGLALYTQRFFQLLSGGASTKTVTMNCLVWLMECETGRCHTQALAFDTPGANVIGRGDIDFQANTIDMMIIPTAKFVNLNPLALPMTVTGPLRNPELSPAPSKITAELTDILFNMISGRSFVYLWRDLLVVMNGQPYSLQTCINTLSNYNQQESVSLTHGL